MRAAADGEDGSVKHVAMENRLYPLRELYGELLLEAGQPAAASKEFETALEQTPNRYRTFLGLARAANAAGDRQKASDYYGKLVNLVKNALEAMTDGGQLVARTRLTRSGAALDLIDTGCGMDDHTAMNMFEAFYSTKDGGTGLGLPTARKIIEAHGGRIDVQSQVGHGTKFTLEFPTPARLGREAPEKAVAS